MDNIFAKRFDNLFKKRAEEVKAPESIDENFHKAFKLFNQLCYDVRFTDLESFLKNRKAGGVQSVKGYYKGEGRVGAKVKLGLPLVPDQDRQKLKFAGEQAGIPVLHLIIGSQESFYELIEQFRQKNIAIRPGVSSELVSSWNKFLKSKKKKGIFYLMPNYPND